MQPNNIHSQQQQMYMGDWGQYPQFDMDYTHMQMKEKQLYSLLEDLLKPEQREQALSKLSKNREEFPTLALALWYTPGAMAVLLQEITMAYGYLSPPTLDMDMSTRVCNVLALLKCVAAHEETKLKFLQAHIPLFLYPFLNTVSKERPFEYLRLTSLGVIGALVKGDGDVVKFLLSTEIIPLCLRIMESGSILSKTVATFILQKILAFDVGLQYICATPERFYTVSSLLKNITMGKVNDRLLKHVIRCYMRLSDHPRAREALAQCLPPTLKDDTFAQYYANDPSIRQCLVQLLSNVGEIPPQYM